MIQKKEENGEKYATASDEAEFHEALNRGLAVEVTRELAEKIGVPMSQDVHGGDQRGALRPSRLGMEARYGEEILLAARGRLRAESLRRNH